MPYVLGPVDGPAPPTRTELLLQAENERLRTQLDAARALRAAIDGHDAASSEPLCACIRKAAADYDKRIEETTNG